MRLTISRGLRRRVPKQGRGSPECECGVVVLELPR
uniref:Epl101 n=1 Tax=Arundo donax TaxID=35708 RepID=A0A0A9FZB2_ARUDO